MLGSIAAALQVPGPDLSGFFWIFGLFFIIVVVIIGVGIARMRSGQNVQRPVFTDTAFPPPPPPDTVMVKCQYCGTQQVWKETCVQCGAPLPKPVVGGAA